MGENDDIVNENVKDEEIPDSSSKHSDKGDEIVEESHNVEAGGDSVSGDKENQETKENEPNEQDEDKVYVKAEVDPVSVARGDETPEGDGNKDEGPLDDDGRLPESETIDNEDVDENIEHAEGIKSQLTLEGSQASSKKSQISQGETQVSQTDIPQESEAPESEISLNESRTSPEKSQTSLEKPQMPQPSEAPESQISLNESRTSPEKSQTSLEKPQMPQPSEAPVSQISLKKPRTSPEKSQISLEKSQISQVESQLSADKSELSAKFQVQRSFLRLCASVSSQRKTPSVIMEDLVQPSSIIYIDEETDESYIEPEEEEEELKLRVELVEVAAARLVEKELTTIFLDIMCKKNKDKTKCLILRGNQLVNNNFKRRLLDHDLEMVCQYMTDHETVVAVDLSYNLITSEGIKSHIAPFLKECSNVKELILSNNELSLEALEALADISEELSLTTLRMNGNKLGSKSGMAIARLLKGSKSLVHLDISETDQSVGSLACLTAILRKDYMPCCVNRFPSSRNQFDNDNAIKKEVRRCSTSELALYIKKLKIIEKNKRLDSGTTISSSCRGIIYRTSVFDTRPPQEDKLSISAIASDEYLRFLRNRVENQASDFEKINGISLEELGWPDESLKRKRCVSNESDSKNPVEELKKCNKNKFWLTENYISKERNKWSSLVDLTPARKKVDRGALDAEQMALPARSGSFDVVLEPPEKGLNKEFSEDKLSVFSDDKNEPILKILFLDKILGQYYYQPLTYHFARLLSDMIEMNDSLIELHLEKNSLTDSDVKQLCKGLKRNSTLKLLDLSANHIACQGLSYFADCLPYSGLEALILNHNDISDYGARCLFFSLPSTKLKMLDLAHNAISDEGMMDMLYTMRKHPKIMVLFIWGNPITHISLTKIKEYLLEGWLLTESLDIKIYDVDGVLQHGWRWSADSFKAAYYTRPRCYPDPPSQPPRSYGQPLNFEYYDAVYQRIISEYAPKNYPYPPDKSNTCTN